MSASLFNGTLFQTQKQSNRPSHSEFLVPDNLTLESILKYPIHSAEDIIYILTHPQLKIIEPKNDLGIALLRFGYDEAVTQFEDTDRLDGSNYVSGHLSPTVLGTGYSISVYYKSLSIIPDQNFVPAVLVAGYEHDTPEDIGVPFRELHGKYKKVFGSEIADIVVAHVQGATKYHMMEKSGRVVKVKRKTYEELEEETRDIPLVGAILAGDVGSNIQSISALSRIRQQNYTQRTMKDIIPLIAALGFPTVAHDLTNMVFAVPTYKGPRNLSIIFERQTYQGDSYAAAD